MLVHTSRDGSRTSSTTLIFPLPPFSCRIVHVLPDAHEMLVEASPNYPLAFAMALNGVLLIVALNQLSRELSLSLSLCVCGRLLLLSLFAI